MKFFSIIGVLFYTLVLCLLGGLIIAFALHLIQIDYILSLLSTFYLDVNLRLIIGLTGILLIFVSISFAQLLLGKIQKERTIAFNNPSGQVSVSLSAVEDLLRRLSLQLNEIKEIRPDVVVNKKGIHIDLRVVLRSEVNIPDLTLRLQELIKSRVQELLGVEEEIKIRVHISKIISKKEDKKHAKEDEPLAEEVPPSIPFKGYGRS